MTAVLWLVGSYLVGSIPTSWLVVRLVRGQDLRTLGSGNLGATNLYRQLGWRWAIPVGLIDVVKGVVPVLWFGPRLNWGLWGMLAAGAVAIAGHVFSVFVRFRGGKGVATGAGVVLALAPWAAAAAFVVWALVVRLTGYVSLGSITAAVTLPLGVWLLHAERRELVLPFALLAATIVLLHRANIQRLRTGTEHRFGRGVA